MYEHDIPSFNHPSRLIMIHDSHQEVAYLKEQLLIKENELMRKNEEIIAIKMKKERKKLLQFQTKEVDKQISEYKKTFNKNDLNLLLKKNQISDQIIVYKENVSEITILQKNLEAKTLEISSLQGKIIEIEQKFKNQIDGLANSHKAHLIIIEESTKFMGKELLKEKENLIETIKILKEKILILEVHLARIRTKKKNLKNLYHETLKKSEYGYDELRKYYEEEIIALKRNIDGFEGELKGVLSRNEELEEEIREFYRDKEQILKDLAMEKREKTLYKSRFEELLGQIKEMRGMKEEVRDNSLRNVETYYENMQEIIGKCMRNCEDRSQFQEKERVIQQVYSMPSAVSMCHCNKNGSMCHCINNGPICNCSNNGTFVIEKERPIIKERNPQCIHLEDTLREIKTQYINIKKDLQTLFYEDNQKHMKVEICFILDREFLASLQFKDLLLNLSQVITQRDPINLQISTVILAENEILMGNFKNLESFLDEEPMKIPIKSLNDLSWTLRSRKFIVNLIAQNVKIAQITTFLASNLDFLHKFKPKLISLGLNLALNNEGINYEVEELPWEDFSRLPRILTEMMKF